MKIVTVDDYYLPLTKIFTVNNYYLPLMKLFTVHKNING